MKKGLFALFAVLMSFGFAQSASAGPITWNFGGSNGFLGQSTTFSSGGFDLPASAFWVSNANDSTYTGAQIQRFGNGIGVRNSGGDNGQIDDNGRTDILRFNLSGLGEDPISAILANVQGDDSWQVRASNSAEVSINGMTLIESGIGGDTTANLGSGSGFNYLFFVPHVGFGTDDFVVKSLTANVPMQVVEPASILLFGIGLIGLAGTMRRRRTAEA